MSDTVSMTVLMVANSKYLLPFPKFTPWPKMTVRVLAIVFSSQLRRKRGRMRQTRCHIMTMVKGVGYFGGSEQAVICTSKG